MASQKDDTMGKRASLGFWTCAAVYAAIGAIGLFFLSGQPNIANATEGYGTVGLAVRK
jgi:hypothetical protein